MQVRLVRDPVHGDIQVPKIASAIIDTRIFQRLRYIRQNGLLHFVFPGAVHTRFLHSIGTMAVATKAISRLFAPIRAHANRSQQVSLKYVCTAFELAALLHDIGHCAFSHSIENVRIKKGPLLGTVEECLSRWKDTSLLADFKLAHPSKLARPAEHEQIGLSLVGSIFQVDTVQRACADESWSSVELLKDVRALMDGGLGTSAAFVDHAAAIRKMLSKIPQASIAEAPADRFAQDLLAALHSLISGTLDVDRLDYLIRDSHHCGVPYGYCDLDVLLGSLSLGGFIGQLELFLGEKAQHALLDMLWSRYQLFVQVLNHKTNVGLNAALADALADAVNDGVIAPPATRDEYVLFTDDFVMSQVIAFCVKARRKDTTYARALVDRRVPRLVASADVGPSEEYRRVGKIKATELGLDPKDVMYGEAKSEFIKGGPLPMLLSWDRMDHKRHARRFDAAMSMTGIPVKYHKVHLFVDRQS